MLLVAEKKVAEMQLDFENDVTGGTYTHLREYKIDTQMKRDFWQLRVGSTTFPNSKAVRYVGPR